MDLNFIQTIAIWALPVIFAITLHEAAHGYVARYFGDPTAYVLGRVTLNPVKHIDPIGTIAIPLGLFLLGKLTGGATFLFGWAKPVPVNFMQLKHPKRDMLWVAAAGPAVNFLMAMAWAILIPVGAKMGGYFAQPMMLMGAAGIMINVSLMALNLLPIPPLDGGRMLISILPRNLSNKVAALEPYGFMVLIFLMAFQLLGPILGPVISFTVVIIASIFNINIPLLQFMIGAIT